MRRLKSYEKKKDLEEENTTNCLDDKATVRDSKKNQNDYNK